MSEKMFTGSDFKFVLSKPDYHNVILVRCGSFVGIYRYDNRDNKLHLWRKINDESYAQRSTIPVQSEGKYWGMGGSNGISSVLEVNEAHLIPKGYRLDNRDHLQMLDDCLGGTHTTVKKRIREYEP